MEPNETPKTQNGHNVSIALIQKDIQYMRESVTKIETTLQMLDKNFARKEELIQLEKIVGDMAGSWKKDLEEISKNKVSHTDFDPIKTTLARINWMVITAVVVGLLALIIRTGGGGG